MAQQPVAVEIGAGAVGPGPRLQGAAARVEVGLRGTRGHPVLEAVGGDRRLGVVGNEQEPGHAPVPQIAQPLGVAGPPHELNIHTCNIRADCFTRITSG